MSAREQRLELELLEARREIRALKANAGLCPMCESLIQMHPELAPKPHDIPISPNHPTSRRPNTLTLVDGSLVERE
jgi:hypothetical protein